MNKKSRGPPAVKNKINLKIRNLTFTRPWDLTPRVGMERRNLHSCVRQADNCPGLNQAPEAKGTREEVEFISSQSTEWRNHVLYTGRQDEVTSEKCSRLFLV